MSSVILSETDSELGGVRRWDRDLVVFISQKALADPSMGRYPSEFSARGPKTVGSCGGSAPVRQARHPSKAVANLPSVELSQAASA
ncbi:hypothetical protein CGZ80_02835 [Rhodopirellula sp. MGV]|nr:hypothetical protein CGZ80_02835 [Rhodopirellula sp. MGV]PNY38513.1 hypothetical protein C2E31_00865 [Rhodopirellula baltica]